jgi:hypothetical protein
VKGIAAIGFARGAGRIGHAGRRGGKAKGGAPPVISRPRPALRCACCFYMLLQRPKFIAPTSPNDALEPFSPIGMLTLGLMLNRELNTNPVPSVSSP